MMPAPPPRNSVGRKGCRRLSDGPEPSCVRPYRKPAPAWVAALPVCARLTVTVVSGGFASAGGRAGGHEADGEGAAESQARRTTGQTAAGRRVAFHCTSILRGAVHRLV